MSERTSRQIARQMEVLRPLLAFMTESEWGKRQGSPEINDFVVGNPHDMPIEEFGQALARASMPENPEWFAYKMNEPEALRTVVKTLREFHGMPFEEEDILMTSGAFAGIAITLRAVVDAGDEVIFSTPPWFFYDAMISLAGAMSVKVPVRRDTWDLDLAAIEAAITERTRMVIVNSPNNPTGRIYPPETLERLGEILRAASGRNGRAVYLLSDESYSRIVYDGRDFPTPTRFYADSFLIYTYGKTLLTPGTRVGYVALPPEMPEREEMRGALFLSSVANGWQFPNAVALHALPDFEHLSIDIPQLQRRRDKVVPALQEAGYETHSPEGTFYLLVKAPWENDLAFTELLAEQDVFVLPGSLIDSPGYFRVSLTASDEMVERGLPGFAAAMEKAKATTEPPKSEMAGVGTTRTTPSPGPQSGPACFA